MLIAQKVDKLRVEAGVLWNSVEDDMLRASDREAPEVVTSTTIEENFMKSMIEPTPSTGDLTLSAVLTDKSTICLELKQFISDTHVMQVVGRYDESLPLPCPEDGTENILFEKVEPLLLLALHGAAAHLLEHLSRSINHTRHHSSRFPDPLDSHIATEAVTVPSK